MTADPLPVSATCPAWCTTQHGVYIGEDDHLHTGAPLYLTETVLARLCETVDPDTGSVDGPYVIIDSEEWTLDHTRSVGRAVIALADIAESRTDPSGPRLA